MSSLRAGLIGAVVWASLLLQGPEAFALEPLPAPSGPVILTIAGKIAVHNTTDGKAAFDLAMLEALPPSRFKTTTIWTDGVQAFDGVSIADLLARLGGTGTEIKVTAANEYEIRFPLADALDHGAIIAYRANGAPLPRGNKGPLWIVYPYDSQPELLNERFLGESAWNLETITLY